MQTSALTRRTSRLPQPDPLKTVYGKYIKAYIDIDWEDKNNHDALNDDTNCNGDANYVTIIVNSDEPTYRCDLK